MTKTEKMVDLLARIVLNAGDEASAVDELKAMLEDSAPEQLRSSIENAAEDLLLEVGVPCHILGHGNLKQAIAIVVDNPSLRYYTTEVYARVVKEAGEHTTPSRVERSIRHAISLAFDRCGCDVLYKYFGNTIDPNKGKPTNAEFIATMAREVQRRLAC